MKTVALVFWKRGGANGQFIKIWQEGGAILTAFEVVQTILSFGSFTVAVIGLCYKIFKDDDKKK